MYLLILLVFHLFAGALALRKGYSFWLWLFAVSPFGLIILAFLPDLNHPDIPPEKRDDLRKQGNWDAIILLIIGIIGGLCCINTSSTNIGR
jgi:hypothetical protein